MRETAAGVRSRIDEHHIQRAVALTQQMDGRARAGETAAEDQDS
jgi:hypothetical protein